MHGQKNIKLYSIVPVYFRPLRSKYVLPHTHRKLTYMAFVFLDADYENEKLFTSPTVPEWQTRMYLCYSRHSQASLCL